MSLINKKWQAFYEKFLESEEQREDFDQLFSNDLSINSHIKSDNLFARDCFGLIIRKKHQNTKNKITSWKFVLYKGRKIMINSNVPGDLLFDYLNEEKINVDEIFQETIIRLKASFPKEFNDKGLYHRVYYECKPELFKQF
jgi:hypothetical protein